MSIFGPRFVLTGNGKVLGIGLMGVGAYNSPLVMSEVIAFVKTTASGGGGGGGGGGSGNGGGAAVVDSTAALLRAVGAKLDRAVDRLALQSGGGGQREVHVVTQAGSTSTTTVVLVALAAMGGTAVVLWRGKYVTREHFAAAVHTVTDGLTAVSRTVDALKGNMREVSQAGRQAGRQAGSWCGDRRATDDDILLPNIVHSCLSAWF